jgi:hypothetical protein
MGKIHIEFIAKDLSLECDPIEIESDFVPQVGQLIDGGDYVKKPSGASPYYIVSSIVYELTKNGFVPHVTARSWYKGVRSELLQQRGWLPPAAAMDLLHDEDDSHLSDGPSPGVEPPP